MPILASTRLHIEGLRCTCCAKAVLAAVRALPAVDRAQLDYTSGVLEVEHDPQLISQQDLRHAVRASGYRTAADPPNPSTGELAHTTDMTPITCCTTNDRMQYELPHGGAERAHKQPADYPHAGHGGMDHEMSAPTMAAAMERDMRNRFFIALVLTVPVIIVSPLGYNTFGIRPIDSETARNLIALVLSAPVVWYAGWIFIGGAYTSLRSRTLNMAVLVATGVLAAWLGSAALTFWGRRPSSTRPPCW